MTLVERWHGSLPAGWHMVQLRRVATIRNGSDYKAVEVEAGGYPVYGSGGAFRRAGTYLYEGPSVLFGRKGTIDRPLLVETPFWTVDTMFYTELNDQVEPRFLHYYALTIPYSYYTTSTALPSVTQSDLGGHHIPLPSRKQQRRIADYLDRETAQIDTLISEQQRLIELIDERRSALVANATGWGEHSHTWPMKRLSWLFRSTGSGTTPKPEDIADPGAGMVPWATTGELREQRIASTAKAVSQHALSQYSSLRVHPAGSLVVAMYGATIGRMAILDVPAATNQACCVLSDPAEALPEFVQYSLLAARPRLLLEASGGGQPNINQDKLRSFRIPAPTAAEQLRIVRELDGKTAVLDRTKREAERLIFLSRERRTALITAAVTGQIKIPEAS